MFLSSNQMYFIVLYKFDHEFCIFLSAFIKNFEITEIIENSCIYGIHISYYYFDVKLASLLWDKL